MALRSKLIAVSFAVTCLVLGSPLGSFAQKGDEAADFPSRPIRIIVGFTPGGQPDIYARLIAPKLIEVWQKPVLVENRPGAGGVVGAQSVAGAKPDGYTLLSTTASHAISPAIYSKLPYDTLKDFAGVTMSAAASYLLVVPPSLNVKSVQDLIALAKDKPGQVKFASAGTGSGTHFAGELFKQSANIDVLHIPYKGIPETITDTMTGRVQFTMLPLASSLAMVKEGRLRALAVTSKKRVSIYPDVPTIAESGFPGFEWDSWSGILAPAKTPRPVINKLNREITRILDLPEIQERIRALGAEPAPSTPAEFDQFVAEQLRVVAQLVKKAGIEAQ
jgi:tripartite-type tricarboxylate transporter receptor subunit TctC